MARALMVVATEADSGKSVLSLGLLDQFERHGARACYFKPVAHEVNGTPDADVLFVNTSLGLDNPLKNVKGVGSDEIEQAIKDGTYDQVLDRILESYSTICPEADVVICEGVDSMRAFPSLDSDINIDIAQNIDATLLLVSNLGSRSVGDVVSDIIVARNQYRERGIELLGVVMNRVDRKRHGELSDMARRMLKSEGIQLYGMIPDLPVLSRPRVVDVARALDAEVLAGELNLEGRIDQVLVAAMGLENALYHLEDEALIITPGDREEILLAAGAAAACDKARPAGVVLTGGFEPRRKVLELVDLLVHGQVPILRVEATTFEAAIAVNNVKPAFSENQDDKALAIRRAVDEYVEIGRLMTNELRPAHPVVTPRRFLRELRDRAASSKQTIVLPEGDVDRILKAAAEIRRLDVANIILCGEADTVRRRARRLDLALDSGVEIVDPRADAHVEEYVQTLLELRKHKNLPENVARDLMQDRNYFGTMMVYKGRASGMVSGSMTTTQATLRPAFEFVRTRAGFKSVSSVFFMCLPDRVLVYGDCAVIPNPTVEQLAEIALASADTAQAFGIDPRVAMLSYSTGTSGKGEDVERVRAAAELVHQRNPELKLEGPIQYDAAIDPGVARTKLPDSVVAGQANVFIFPDLNTGNNTYKAVQRSANAIAVGPILQGLKKPVNDLSRGATITDIVNTVVVTAIQAQSL